MQSYRLDPNNPRRLTADEARRLARTPIGYSDIPPLDAQFFLRAELQAIRRARRTWPALPASYQLREAELTATIAALDKARRRRARRNEP
jgi:hypothetical protein